VLPGKCDALPSGLVRTIIHAHGPWAAAAHVDSGASQPLKAEYASIFGVGAALHLQIRRTARPVAAWRRSEVEEPLR